MQNIPFEERLNISLVGPLREKLEPHILPIKDWDRFLPSFPKPCADVVTGKAFYAGCEGIGFHEEIGWFLVLWEPNEEPPVNSITEENVKAGFVIASAQVCAGPTKEDPGKLLLIYAQRPDSLLEHKAATP